MTIDRVVEELIFPNRTVADVVNDPRVRLLRSGTRNHNADVLTAIKKVPDDDIAR